MKNVLLAYKRYTSDGSLKGKDGKVIEYDNVRLIVGKLDDYGMGITAVEPYKVPVKDFPEIVGVTYEDFCDLFATSYFGHGVTVLGSIEYEKFKVSTVDISPEDCMMQFTSEAVEYFDENIKKLVRK